MARLVSCFFFPSGVGKTLRSAVFVSCLSPPHGHERCSALLRFLSSSLECPRPRHAAASVRARAAISPGKRIYAKFRFEEDEGVNFDDILTAPLVNVFAGNSGRMPLRKGRTDSSDETAQPLI